MTVFQKMHRPLLLCLLVALALGAAVVLWPEPPMDDWQDVDRTAAEQDAAPHPADAELDASVTSSDEGEESQREELDPLTATFADALVIEVCDAQGEPAAGKTVAVTTMDVLEIWLIDAGATTNAAGRAVMDRARLRTIAETNRWHPVQVGVWDAELRGFLTFKEISLEQTKQVTLNLPSVEGIVMTLRDFPAGVEPVLSPVEGHAQAHLEFQGAPQTDGSFQFRHLPLGADWDLYLERTETILEGGNLIVPSRLELASARVPGPAAPGECLTLELTPRDFGLLVGRFVDRNGDALPFTPAHTGKGMRSGYGPWSLGAWAWVDGEEPGPREVSLELFDEGVFLGSVKSVLKDDSDAFNPFTPIAERDNHPQGDAERWADLTQVRELHVSWQPMDSEGLMPGPSRMHDAMAARAALVPGADAGHLGDITLRPEAAQMEIFVVDQHGAPVPHAEVVCRLQWSWRVAAGRAEEEVLQLRPSMPYRCELRTNREGVARWTTPSWEFTPSFYRPGIPGASEPQLQGVHIAVRPRDHVPVETLVSVGTQEVTIELPTAGSIEGWLALPEESPFGFRAVAYPAGTRSSGVDAVATEGVDRHRRGVFEIKNLPAGTFDVEVYWGSENWPITSVENVVVRGGRISKPPALQGLDLAAHLSWVAVKPSHDAAGSLEHEFAIVSVEGTARDNGVITHGLFASNDGFWRFPLPRGVSSWTGSLSFDGYRIYQATGLKPGQHLIDFQPVPHLVLQVEGVPGRYGRDWRLVATSEIASPDMRGFNIIELEGMPVLAAPGPTVIRLRWFVASGNGWKYQAESSLTLTEEDLDRESLPLTPPEAMLQR